MKYEIFNALHLAALISKSECAPHRKRDIIQKEAQRRKSLLKSFFMGWKWSILELFDLSGVVRSDRVCQESFGSQSYTHVTCYNLIYNVSAVN